MSRTLLLNLLLKPVAGVALLAGSLAANAADLPSRKADPASYVKVCDAYGTGFFFIPGTDTCLRIGGRARLEVGWISRDNIMLPPVIGNGNATPNANAFNVSTTTGATTAGTMAPFAAGAIDSTGTHIRAIVTLDARTPTPFGTVRTSIWIRPVSESGLFPSNFIRGNFNGGNSSSLTVENTFVQWAGFTAGRTRENFTFMPGTAYIAARRAGFASGIPQLTYTHVFGGGLAGTIALEDWANLNSSFTAHSLGGITGGAFQRGGVVAIAAPMVLPAIVGNVRYDQKWGSAQIMGAAVENKAQISRPGLFAAPGLNTTTVKQWGYAIGAGVKFNLPMIAAGDELWLQAGWSRGAFDWMISNNTSAQTSDNGHQLPGLQRIDRNMTVFGIGGNAGAGGQPVALGSELTTAWQLAGAFIHYWSPQLRSVVNASYIDITPGTQTRNTDWSLGGMSKANAFNIAKALIFAPVRDFEIGLEVGYMKLNQTLTGTAGAAPSPLVFSTAVPAGFTARVSPNVLLLRGRVERTF